jgi:putative ATP-binding cassette transporter
LFPGSLRDQFRAADPQGAEDDVRVRSALQAVGLGESPARVGGLDADVDWSEIFSLRDQQALVVARALFAKPRFAVFDGLEASMGSESREFLDRINASGIGCLAVAAGNDPAGSSDAVLQLFDKGKWSIQKRGEG